jgi:hypothetical protein
MIKQCPFFLWYSFCNSIEKKLWVRHYWDEKESHLISMIKTGVAALTGTKGLDGSVQGDIKL